MQDALSSLSAQPLGPDMIDIAAARDAAARIAADVFPYSSKSLAVGRFNVAFVDEGTANASAGTILCVHGNPTWSFYYRRVIERFSDRYRVVAVDHLGCGRSDKPRRSEFAYTLAAHRDNLVEVIDQRGLDRVTLLAHDWGGAIGLAAMLKRPEILQRIILLNTGAFPPPYVPWRIAACRLPLLGTIALRQFNLFALAATTMAVNRNPLSREAKRGLLAPYDNWNHRVAIDAFVRDIPMSPSHPTHATLKQLEQDLSKLAETPSLLVWGMKDWCFRPECLRRFQTLWPNAVAKEIADAGHYVLEDAPEETLEAIENFLAPGT